MIRSNPEPAMDRDAIPKGALPVIDLDGHVIEPAELWTRYIDAPYQACAPRQAPDSWGVLRLLVESRLYPTPEGPGRAPRRVLSPEELDAYHRRLTGGYDPHYRIRDMDTEGIAAVLLMPSQAMVINAVRDPGLALAIARAYNTWLAEYCRPYPERLLGAALLPLQDPSAAVVELERCVRDLGFRAAFLRPNPVFNRTLADPLYDPLYDAIERLDVLLQIHEGCGFSPGATVGIDRFENGAFSHLISHPFEQMLAAATLICGGVLERHPALRVTFMEAGCGWMPSWLERMDEHAERYAWELPWLRRAPSEYFARQCAVGCDVHERGAAWAVMELGAGRVVFSTDYPHSDGVFPGAVSAFRARTDIPEDAKPWILGGNAARLLKLPIGRGPAPMAAHN